MDKLNQIFTHLALSKAEMLPCTSTKPEGNDPVYGNEENCDPDGISAAGAVLVREFLYSGCGADYTHVHSTPTLTNIMEESLVYGSDSSLLLDESVCELTKLKAVEPDKPEQKHKEKSSPDDPFQLGFEYKPKKSVGTSKAIPRHVPTGLLVDIDPQSNTWADKTPKLEGVMTRSRAKQVEAGESPISKHETSFEIHTSWNKSQSPEQMSAPAVPTTDERHAAILIEEKPPNFEVRKPEPVIDSICPVAAQPIRAIVCTAMGEKCKHENTTETVTTGLDQPMNSVDDPVKLVHYEFVPTQLMKIDRPLKHPLVGVVRPQIAAQIPKVTQPEATHPQATHPALEVSIQQSTLVDGVTTEIVSSTKYSKPNGRPSARAKSKSVSRPITQPEPNIEKRQTKRSVQPNIQVSTTPPKTSTKVSTVTAKRRSMNVLTGNPASSSQTESARVSNKRQSLARNSPPKTSTVSNTNPKISSVTAKRLSMRLQAQQPINEPDQTKPKATPSVRKSMNSSDFKPPSGSNERTTRTSLAPTDVKSHTLATTTAKGNVSAASPRPPSGASTSRPMTRRSMVIGGMKPPAISSDSNSSKGAMANRQSLLPPRPQSNSKNQNKITKSETPNINPATASTPKTAINRRSVTPYARTTAGVSSDQIGTPSTPAVAKSRRLSTSLPR